MRGRRTTQELTEKIHALRLALGPEAIAKKLGVPRRTVAAVLKRTDSPAIEAKRQGNDGCKSSIACGGIRSRKWRQRSGS